MAEIRRVGNQPSTRMMLGPRYTERLLLSIS